MVKLIDGTKVPLWDYFYFFCIIIFAGNASVFTREYGMITSFASVFALTISIITAVRHKVRLGNDYIAVFGVFVSYYVMASIFNRYFSVGFITYWFLNITIAYLICKCYATRFVLYFETIVFHLSIIGLLIWASYLVLPNVVQPLLLKFQFSESFTDELNAINVIVYTLLDYQSDFFGSFHAFYRNSGFAFEPGAYSVFLCFAVACNICRNQKIKISGNIPLLIYFAALFSTESTTGGGTLIAILFAYFLPNTRSLKGWILLLLLIPFGFFIFQLDFVGEKFLDELSDSTTLSYSFGGDSGTGRIMSFRLLFQEYLNRPVFGLAGNPNTILSRMGFTSSVHSGFGRLLSQFGTLMSIMFFVALSKSIKLLNKKFDLFGWTFFAALLGSMVSYSMWESPIFLTFIVMGLFVTSDEFSQAEDNYNTKVIDGV